MAAPRAMWSGTISFGMVSIPVKAYKAADSTDISFNTLHTECGRPINQIKVCRTCETGDKPGEPLPTTKGYQHAKGQFVVVTDEDLQSLPLPAMNTIAITEFVPVEALDPVQIDGSYFVGSDRGGARPYALLVAVLAERNLAAIATVAFRKREQLCALRVDRLGHLVLHTLYRREEVREVPVEVGPALTDTELGMAKLLVDMQLRPEYNPDAHPDRYETALAALIQAKLGGEVLTPGVVAPAPVMDLEAALRASLAA